MCLPFGRLFSNADPIVPITQKGAQLRGTMQIILGLHLLLSLFKMILMGPFMALSDLISCAILYCGLN